MKCLFLFFELGLLAGLGVIVYVCQSNNGPGKCYGILLPAGVLICTCIAWAAAKLIDWFCCSGCSPFSRCCGFGCCGCGDESQRRYYITV